MATTPSNGARRSPGLPATWGPSEAPTWGASSGWRRLGRHRFKKTLLRRVIRGEGMWLEPSAGYQLLVTGITQKFLAIPGVKMPRLERLLHRMVDVAGWLFEPDHRIVQFGDTEIDRGAPGILHRSAKDRGML